MGFNITEPQSADDLFDCALDLMRSGKYAPALRCLLQISSGPGFLSAPPPGPASRKPEESPALFYNLALCYIEAEDFQGALKELENSLKLIKK
jgi:tetratricopeptide (TPR) repeat protein